MTSSRRAWSWRMCYALYRAWLWWYPSVFRREQGDDAARLFADVCTDGGLRVCARRAVRALVSVPRDGLRERGASAPPGATPETWMPRGLVRDLGDVLRSFRRRPGLMSGVVTTLALGVGANTAMFSVADALLIRFLPYPDADRVVYLRVRTPATGRERNPTSAELHAWRATLQSFERLEARTGKSVLLTGDAGAARVRMLQLTPGLLEAMRARPIAGRPLHPADSVPAAAPVVILSERLWTRRYARDPGVVSRTILVDGQPHAIVGVIADLRSDTPGLRFDLFGPLPAGGPGAHVTPAPGVGWLRPGISMEAAQQEAAALAAIVNSRGEREHAELARPRNIFFAVTEFRDSAIALLASTFLLLAVAWVNVGAMLLAAARARRGELALRGALGASRARLVQGLLVESLVLALLGCVAGLLLARAAIGAFTRLNPSPQLSAGLEAARIDLWVMMYAVVLSLLTACAAGGWAAIRSSGQSLAAALQDVDGRRAGRQRASGLFIAAQTALSLVLMVAAGLTGRTFLTMRLADPGFAADRVLSVQLALPADAYPTPQRRAAFFDAVLDGTKRLPGVVDATLGYGATPPSDFMSMGTLTIEGSDTISDFKAETSFISPSHFQVMSIPMLAGRAFDAFDSRLPGDAQEVPLIVSRSLAERLWPGQHPVGRGLRLADSRRTVNYRVVGMAADVRGRDLEWLDHPERGWHVYLPLRENRAYTEVIVRVADGQPLPVADLSALIRRIDPRVPADEELQSGAASLYRLARRARFRAVLFGVFSIAALALCALGITAVIGHQVSRRTREVGVRMALGARPADVRRLMLRQGFMPVAAGMAAGLMAAAVAVRPLRRFLPGVGPADPATLVTVVVVIAAVVFVAIRVPVGRAVRVDPIDALRAD